MDRALVHLVNGPRTVKAGRSTALGQALSSGREYSDAAHAGGGRGKTRGDEIVPVSPPYFRPQKPFVRMDRKTAAREEFRLASCEGKARLARKRAIEVARNMRDRGERAQPYRCRFCGHYHVGRRV